MVRVRFAPSPTGLLHIGSVRTALFNFLFAKSQNGVFILRIEDTDKERSKKVFLKEIFDTLDWLGLNWDEGPYYQSQRIKIYQRVATELLDKGLAYREGRAVIFKLPAEKIRFKDIIHGDIEFEGKILGEELVLIKSNGLPAYNFACVVDDIELGITHVIRGDDHISNTPKQVALYNALGRGLPNFAHIPLILGKDLAPLSKRFGATSVKEYKEMGYLSEALVNFLALLGWAPGDNREIIPKEGLMKEFSLKNVNNRGAVFDEDKLKWLNGEYLKNLDSEKFFELAIPFFKKRRYNLKGRDRAWLLGLIEIYKGRVKTLVEFLDQTRFFFFDRFDYDKEAVEKFLKREGVIELLKAAKENLSRVDDFSPEKLENSLRNLISERGIKGGELIHPLRVAVTGRSVSAGIFEVLKFLGKERVLKRLDRTIKMFK